MQQANQLNENSLETQNDMQTGSYWLILGTTKTNKNALILAVVVSGEFKFKRSGGKWREKSQHFIIENITVWLTNEFGLVEMNKINKTNFNKF